MGKSLKLTITVLTLLIMAGMCTVVYLLIQSGSLPEKIGGREDIMAGKLQKRNLLDDLKLAISTEETKTYTEEQVNHYLASKMKLKQGGKFTNQLEIKGFWVKFTKDKVTCYVEREIDWGEGEKQQHITSFMVKVVTVTDKKGGKRRDISPEGGRIGSMPTPGLFAKIAKTPVDKVMALFEEEIKLLSEKMGEMKVTDGSIQMTAAANRIKLPKNSSSGRAE